MGETALRVQFGFQSVISALQTDEQKDYTLTGTNLKYNEILTTVITKRVEICRSMKPKHLNAETCYNDSQM
jgi:hypothetical protein